KWLTTVVRPPPSKFSRLASLVRGRHDLRRASHTRRPDGRHGATMSPSDLHKGNGHTHDTPPAASLVRPRAQTPHLPPSLAARLGRQRRQAVLTFAGQGNGWLDELATLYTESPAAARIIERAADVTHATLEDPRFRWSGYYDHGLPLRKWIATPDARTDAAYLSSSAVSMSLIFLTQIARFVASCEEGLSAAFEADAFQATTGHSQGIMAALLVSESNGAIDPGRFSEYYRVMLWQGLLMDESTPL